MNYCDDYEDNDNNEDEDEYEGILVPKLPVANFDHFDPNLPPVSGEDYLRRVQIEAQKCPEIVVADLDLTKFKCNQTVIVNNSNGFLRAKPEMMASIEWQREQVSDFTRVRLKMSQMKEYRIKMGLNAKPSEGRNRSMWWWKEYCIGKKNSDEESSSDSVCDSEQSTLTDTPNSNDPELKNDKQIKPKANLPLLSFLCDMSSEEVILNLSYHIKWIRQFGFTHQNAIWIYALLVNLEKPLPSEVYSTLRELSRVCSQVRAQIQSITESTILVPLNLIICLIGRYFDQNDMIDE